MKVIAMPRQAFKLEQEYFTEVTKANDTNVIRFVSSEDEKSVQKEMRLIFFSKGNIFLESEEAKFSLRSNKGMSLRDVECFGQLITSNFKRLVSECVCFKYIGSPVSFTLTFLNNKNESLGTLISDSIFKDIGFGKGVGKWVTKND